MTFTYILVPRFVANPNAVMSMADKLTELVWKRIHGCTQWSVWVICREGTAPGIPVMLARIDVSYYQSCADAMMEKNQILATKVLETLTEFMGIGGVEEWILKLGTPLYIYNKRE